MVIAYNELLDTFEVRYALRHCDIKETEHYTTFACEHEPTYVLSRRCTNEYYGAAGPCCKLDDAMNYLINDRKDDLFPHIKYFLHCDDDTYWRADQIMRWLATIENSGISNYPLIANADNGNPSNGGVWHIDGCKDIIASGWYQPLMFNHAALKLMRSSAEKMGVADTCRQFDVTHDVGVGVFGWLFQLNHVKMPRTEINGGHRGSSIFQQDQMIVHCIKHQEEDKCGDSSSWPANLRFNQKVAIGCGDIGVPGPFHNQEHDADMYDAWVYFRDHGTDVDFGKEGVNEFINADVVVDPNNPKLLKKVFLEGEKVDDSRMHDGLPVVKRIIPRMVPLSGYSKTKHAKNHNIVENWSGFKPSDCNDPGKVGR